MKFFKILLILALGLQVGLFGAEGENENDGENYLKYQGNSIVNDGECGKCDAVLDGYVSRLYHYDVASGTTYCYVYKKNRFE